MLLKTPVDGVKTRPIINREKTTQLHGRLPSSSLLYCFHAPTWDAYNRSWTEVKSQSVQNVDTGDTLIPGVNGVIV